MKKILALILARGGSRRIPRKNIADLGGHPLIWYTIQAAKASKHQLRIVVSTDDPDIAAVAKSCGAEVPFLRPKELAQADSLEIDAFKHALSWLKETEGYVPDLIVKLFPTSPFRTTRSIDAAVNLMLTNPEADSVRSVRLCSEHPYKMWRIGANWLLPFVPFDQKPKDAHTFAYHLLPKVYIQNASIDVIKPATIWGKNSVTGTKILPLVMSEAESIDINTPLDLELARCILKNRTTPSS
jgi:N-acylneuraminate cytidylyltransferase